MSSPRPTLVVLSPELATIYRARFDEVRAELALLQERRRQIGHAMREQGCSYREIASVLAVSRSYARDLVIDPHGTARRARTRIVEQRRAGRTSEQHPTGV